MDFHNSGKNYSNSSNFNAGKGNTSGLLSSKAKDFIGKAAPAGYVAGLGRGASGFVTRPDIGPARDGPLLVEGGGGVEDNDRFDDGPPDGGESNEFGLLMGVDSRGRSLILDPEDEEADRIYAEIDAKMGERRKARRERAEEAEERRLEAQKPKTQLLFADLKRDLGRVSEAEWASLPEVGDFRIKRLKRAGAIENPKERFLPLPDSIHSSLLARTQTTTTTNEEEGESEADFFKIGEARGKLLGMHLDQAASSTAEPSSSLHEEEMANGGGTNVGDLKRARALFASIIRSNRQNPAGWMSAARLESSQGNNPKQARALILKGCEECPESEDIWMEAIRIVSASSAPESREILAKALKNIPSSIKLWRMAVEQEPDVGTKRKILRSALERNAESVDLWMALVELEENEEDARLILTKAVECAPKAPELWLALAHLQSDPLVARQVLNRARTALPDSLTVWVHAARLEEAQAAGSSANEIERILARGANELASRGHQIGWKEWMEEAEGCEEGGDILTAQEISKLASSFLVKIKDENEAIKTIMEYTEGSQHPVSSEYCLKSLLEAYPQALSAWKRLIGIYRGEERFSELELIYRSALGGLSSSRDLWLSFARDVPGKFREILSEARRALGEGVDSAAVEEFWCEEIRLSFGGVDRESLKTALIEMWSSMAQDSATNLEQMPSLLQEFIKAFEVLNVSSELLDQVIEFGLRHHPRDEYFWLVKGRRAGGSDSVWNRALAFLPTNVNMALEAASSQSNVPQARVILEKCKSGLMRLPAKLRPSDFDQLLVALCLLEIPLDKSGTLQSLLPAHLLPFHFNFQRFYSAAPASVASGTSSLSAAKLQLNQGLKECPKSTSLHLLAVLLEPRQLRRSKAIEALRRFDVEATAEGATHSTSESVLPRITLMAVLRACGDDLGALKEARTSLQLLLLAPPPSKSCNADHLAILQSFYPQLSVQDEIPNVLLAEGVNWRKFVEKQGLYYEKITLEAWNQFVAGAY